MSQYAHPVTSAIVRTSSETRRTSMLWAPATALLTQPVVSPLARSGRQFIESTPSPAQISKGCARGARYGGTARHDARDLRSAVASGRAEQHNLPGDCYRPAGRWRLEVPVAAAPCSVVHP